MKTILADSVYTHLTLYYPPPLPENSDPSVTPPPPHPHPPMPPSPSSPHLTAALDAVVVILLGSDDVAVSVLVPQLVVHASGGHEDDGLTLIQDVVLDRQSHVVQLTLQHEKLAHRHDG